MKSKLIFKSFFILLLLPTFIMNLEAQTNAIFTSEKISTYEKESYFDGFYLGLSAGSQNIFGGAFIDNLDVLAQKSGFVVEFSSGYRKQVFKDRLVLGAEIQYGITEGNLEHIDPRNQLAIQYENNSQFGYGLNIGYVMGTNKKGLLYTYASITKRNFDISITATDGNTFEQKDGQRFLRYGIGLETPVYKNFNLRATVGRIDVNYGDLITNMDVEDKMDFNLGLVYQF